MVFWGLGLGLSRLVARGMRSVRFFGGDWHLTGFTSVGQLEKRSVRLNPKP